MMRTVTCQVEELFSVHLIGSYSRESTALKRGLGSCFLGKVSYLTSYLQIEAIDTSEKQLPCDNIP